MTDARQFAWVNKNASNIASKDHVTIDNSHAQVVTQNQRRQHSTRYSKKSTSNKRLDCRKPLSPVQQIKEKSKAGKNQQVSIVQALNLHASQIILHVIRSSSSNLIPSYHLLLKQLLMRETWYSIVSLTWFSSTYWKLTQLQISSLLLLASMELMRHRTFVKYKTGHSYSFSDAMTGFEAWSSLQKSISLAVKQQKYRC